MDALEFLEVIEKFDVKQPASEAFAECVGDVLTLNQEQLLEGKLSSGEDITPTYFDDPYFKTPEAAKKYSDWKDKITPNPKRKSGTPNLFIIGTFHRSLGLEVEGENYSYVSTFEKEIDIVRKFSEEIYGLSEEKREILIEEKLEELFFDKVHEKLGL